MWRVRLGDSDVHAISYALVPEPVCLVDQIAAGFVCVNDDQAESRIDGELAVAEAWFLGESGRSGD